jgi:Fic family protein
MPGYFKDRNNVAGLTSFVDKELVQGTLIKGYDLCNALTDPFRKAAFVMFMISEVHPFLDGNGRIARIMMNAELVAAGRSKIMIPTVYRDDYLGALRRLSRRDDPDPYIRMLQRAYDFSVTVRGDDIRSMQQHLQSCNAFLEPTEGKLQF